MSLYSKLKLKAYTVLNPADIPPKKWLPQKGDTVMIGGVYRLLTLKKYVKMVGPTGSVLGCEANSKSHSLITEEANNIPNLTYLNRALWDKKTTMKFEGAENEYHGFDKLVTDGIPFEFPDELSTKTTVDVPCDTIDNITKEQGIKSLDFLELTINGAEIQALDGAKEIIKNSPNLRLRINSAHPNPLDGVLAFLFKEKFDYLVTYQKKSSLANKDLTLAHVWAKKNQPGEV